MTAIGFEGKAATNLPTFQIKLRVFLVRNDVPWTKHIKRRVQKQRLHQRCLHRQRLICQGRMIWSVRCVISLIKSYLSHVPVCTGRPEIMSGVVHRLEIAKYRNFYQEGLQESNRYFDCTVESEISLCCLAGSDPLFLYLRNAGTLSGC